MEKARKNLKETSIVVLLFAAMSLVRMVVEFIFRKSLITTIPEGLTEGIVNVSLFVLFAFGILFLIPQVYVGIKGMLVAKGGTASNAYIVWAKILFVLSVIAVIASTIGLIGKTIAFSDIIVIVDSLLDAIIFFLFVKGAKAVALK